jgi:hypothetical protein
VATELQAQEARSRHEARIMAMTGVTGMDQATDASGARIRIFVESLAAVPAELRSLRDLDAVPVELVERRFHLE